MARKRTVGAVTGSSTAGATAGAAIAQIITWVFPQASEIEAAITVLLTLALGIVAGYLVPPKGEAPEVTEVKSMGPEDFESEDALEDVPDGSVDFARHVDE